MKFLHADIGGKKAIVTGFARVAPRNFFLHHSAAARKSRFRLLITGRGARERCQSTAHLSTPWMASRARKNELAIVHQSGGTRITMLWRTGPTRGAKINARGLFPSSTKQCRSALPGADIIVCRAGAINRRRKIGRRGPGRHLYPLWKEPRIATSFATRRKMVPPRAAGRPDFQKRNSRPKKLTGEVFSLLDQPQEIEKLSYRRRAKLAPPSCRARTL